MNALIGCKDQFILRNKFRFKASATLRLAGSLACYLVLAIAIAIAQAQAFAESVTVAESVTTESVAESVAAESVAVAVADGRSRDSNGFDHGSGVDRSDSGLDHGNRGSLVEVSVGDCSWRQNWDFYYWGRQSWEEEIKW